MSADLIAIFSAGQQNRLHRAGLPQNLHSQMRAEFDTARSRAPDRSKIYALDMAGATCCDTKLPYH